MNPLKLITLILCAVALFYTLVTVSQSEDDKIDLRTREKLANSDFSSVLVLMKAKADLSKARDLESKKEKGVFVYQALTQVALESQKDLVSFLDDKKVDYQRFYIANMIALKKVHYQLIAEIARRPDVQKIYETPPFEQRPILASARPVDDGLQQPSGPAAPLVRINVDRVWNELKVKGEGIVIGAQDSGVDWQHPALIRQYLGSEQLHDFSWHDAITKPLRNKKNPCGYATSSPCDDDGHGTHTLGTAVGDDGVNNQIGVAPQAKWMACRNMDAGEGSSATYIDCFQFFLAPYAYGADPMKEGRPELAPHIINNSWGCPTYEGCSGREMTPVLEALKLAGIFVVVSAGNDGPECESLSSQPASLTQLVFSVGAVREKEDRIAFFSSKGPSPITGQVGPNITAPGENIRSSIPGKKYESGWSGTSMAGPHVAGAVALLWSAQPKLIGRIDETIQILQSTARPLKDTKTCGGVAGDQIPNNSFGYGLIDVFAAIQKGREL